jgi:hypothetical protein
MALRGLEPSRAMAYLYCVPPLVWRSARSSWTSPVTLWLLLGGALVIGGVAIAQRGTRRKAGMALGPCVERADGQPCRP